MRWTLRRPEVRADVVGLVISGGGSRSSFQIGALRYLYDRQGITPTVFTGTSAGSILAAVLAQSAEPAGQRRALAELERIWLAMRQDSDMFTEQEWYATLRERGPAWVKAFSRQQRRRGTLGRTFARVASMTGGHTSDTAAVNAGDTGDAAESTTTPDSAATPDSADGSTPDAPAGPRAAVESDQPTAGSTWNPINVVELLYALREAGRARPDLEVIVRGAQRERSMYRPGPIVEQLLDPAVFVPERVATSGVTLRVAVVALESGELRYVTETGALVDRHDGPVPGTAPVPLVDALYASCAIPAVFPPVRLGEEHYVDGGVRETLPAEIAVEHLGVTRCFAVVASPPGVPHQESYAEKDMLTIVLRSTAGIMSDEALHDEVNYARRAGATVIAPELDVHDALTIDPGLVTIAMDYGYLRAAEVCANSSEEERQLVRDLVTLRREVWALESDLLGPAAGEDAAGPAVAEPDLAELVALKHRLRALVDQAPQAWLPPGAQDWWRTYERHPWEPPVAPTWAG
ncbi:patatin-like phospholipase family protein [Georgenia yuyongxinii]|nr:patatin-like phospholipase family protein [Georgenia yuyongxinii]